MTAVPDGCVGFVYRIRNVHSGRQYIGRKNFWRRVTKPPLKGQRRKRRVTVESDWRNYFGSCDELKADMTWLGSGAFIRTIERLCRTKAELTYAELEFQVKEDVLTRKLAGGEFAFYNRNIMNRFFR